MVWWLCFLSLLDRLVTSLSERAPEKDTHGCPKWHSDWPSHWNTHGENRSDGIGGAVFFEQGAIKLCILKVFYWQYLQDRVCTITVEKCVNELNHNSWGRLVKTIFNRRKAPTCIFSECMACSRMKGHEANSHDTNEGGAWLQHLKKESCDVVLVMELNIDNKLHYPTNSSLQRHVNNRNWPRLEDYWPPS